MNFVFMLHTFFSMKIYLNSIGCRLNQSEIETIGRQFHAQGHTLTSEMGQADLAVINTCAVTVEAASDSRQMIRKAAREGAKEVIATGCWVTINPTGAASLPGVGRVVVNGDKEHLVADYLNLPLETFDLEPVEREPLAGIRLRTRAFIKVQDGCDNRCTFCITTLVRGEGRSRSLEAVIEEVNAATREGVQEVVLTGVHLGSWGQDFSSPTHLKTLVQTLLRRTTIPRIRLSSLEPWDLDEDFFSLWANEPRLCRHLHLPLQAGCDATLRRMARKTTQGSFRKLVSAARTVCPDIAITTDLIAGFPGETEAEFAETLAFVEEMAFAGGHVFTYSPRPGTAAARMPGQISPPIRRARNAHLRAVIEKSSTRYQARFLQTILPILWEGSAELGPDGWLMRGLSDNYVRVQAVAPQNLWNQITPVRLLAVEKDVVQGVLMGDTPDAQQGG
ncbi:MAG: tRNA (N(6)-L-threonylcarbamoyladenosine(37)-C(2))-methylthiotransferase MtaB [Anaerolineales bacterium]